MWYCSSGSRFYLGAPPSQAGLSYDVVRGVDMGKELFDNDPERAEGILAMKRPLETCFSGIESSVTDTEWRCDVGLTVPRPRQESQTSNRSLEVEVAKS